MVVTHRKLSLGLYDSPCGGDECLLICLCSPEELQLVLHVTAYKQRRTSSLPRVQLQLFIDCVLLSVDCYSARRMFLQSIYGVI